MGDFLKKFALWAVRKALYLSAAAGAVFLANMLGAHENDILGLRLDVAVGGLTAVVMSELRRKFMPEALSALLTGTVPDKY
jgi:hypothetical protein